MLKRFIAQISSITAVLAFLASGVVSAGAVTQGYKTNIAMPNGTVVSLVKGSGDTVEKTTVDNEASLVGVSAESGDALIDLRPAGSVIRIAVSGDTTVLVSNLNGDIKAGDQLVISPLAGITTKFSSDTTTKKIIGVAQQNFNPTSTGTTVVKAPQTDGTTKSITVGRIPVKLLLNDRNDKSSPSEKKQSILAAIAEKLTGRPTSPLRLVASGLVTLSTFAVAGLIMNGTVKSSFISLGRNPLSRDTIIGSMLKVSLLAIAIVGMGVALAYVILIV